MIFRFEPVLLDPTSAASAGVTTRYRYAISLGAKADSRRSFEYTLVDTGLDDVIVPLCIARLINLDLTGAPEVLHTVGDGGKLRVQFAEVELTLIASLTHFVRWRAVVGFADVPRAVLGFRGGLEFFTFTSDTTNMRFTLLPNQRMPAAEARLPAADHATSTP